MPSATTAQIPGITLAPVPQLVTVGPLNWPIDSSLLKIPANQQPTCGGAGTAVPSYLNVGTLYTFAHIGDQIPLHTHVDGNSHYTIALSGRVTYNVQNSDGSLTPTQLNPGTFMFVPDNVAHSFVSIDAGAIVLNIQAAAFNSSGALTSLQGLVTQFQAQITAIQSAINAVKVPPCCTPVA